MAETSSTANVPLQWLDRIAPPSEQVGTRFFLFPHEVGHPHEAGHVVVREESEAVPEAKTAPSGARTSGEGTASSHRETMRMPRARRLSPPSPDRYILLKKYEGFVTSRTEDSFTARLAENQSDYPVIEAEFDLEELSESDRELAVEGAALVWTIGYRYDGSTRKRESAIYLRRLPRWTDKEIAQAQRAAEELTNGIGWE
jgi:hypothetical protein